jgi:hypothetical protein
MLKWILILIPAESLQKDLHPVYLQRCLQPICLQKCLQPICLQKCLQPIGLQNCLRAMGPDRRFRSPSRLLCDLARSTVQISSSTNGPDPLSHFVISRIATSRLGLTASSMLRTPDCRVPEISSRPINGTRSTVQISSSTNGPDPLFHDG